MWGHPPASPRDQGPRLPEAHAAGHQGYGGRAMGLLWGRPRSLPLATEVFACPPCRSPVRDPRAHPVPHCSPQQPPIPASSGLQPHFLILIQTSHVPCLRTFAAAALSLSAWNPGLFPATVNPFPRCPGQLLQELGSWRYLAVVAHRPGRPWRSLGLLVSLRGSPWPSPWGQLQSGCPLEGK